MRNAQSVKREELFFKKKEMISPWWQSQKVHGESKDSIEQNDERQGNLPSLFRILSTANWRRNVSTGALGLLLLHVAFVTLISLQISSDGKLKTKRNSVLQSGLFIPWAIK